VFTQGFRIHEWGGALRWEGFELTPPRPGEALVTIEACGIGRTVVHYTGGSLSTDRTLLPRVPGHELVGVVTDVGDPEDHQGGYAAHAVLPIRNLVPVPPGVDAVPATVISASVATPVHIDHRLAVIGVAIHMIQVASLGGTQVVGLDIGAEKLGAIERFVPGCDVAGGIDGLDIGAEKLGAIERFVPGCDVAGGIDGLDAADLFGGHRPTVVIDFAGKPSTLAWGFGALASGGTMAILASFDDDSRTAATRAA